ncbi:hypothetical protein J3F83DRAFT_232896 [Trichoderma novae-zelandiae]
MARCYPGRNQKQNHSHCVLLQLGLILVALCSGCGGIVNQLPGPLAHPRPRCQAQGAMQGVLSTLTQAGFVPAAHKERPRKSGCLPGPFLQNRSDGSSSDSCSCLDCKYCVPAVVSSSLQVLALVVQTGLACETG